MNNAPLMPKATAVWLVENTSLSFDQIANFCKLHPLEVKAIADGDAATGHQRADPITWAIDPRRDRRSGRAPATHCNCRSQSSPSRTAAQAGPALYAGVTPPGSAKRHPLAGAQPSGAEGRQIMRLVGTTKSTIQAIRNRTHWNSATLTPPDPVTLGLCSQIDLDFEVNRAAKDRPHAEKITARP